MKKFLTFVIFSLVAVIITPLISFGADPIIYMVPESDVLASVSLYNAKIVSQEGNKLIISFDIISEDDSQPQVKYSVSLAKQVKGGSVPVAEKVYTEMLSLAKGQVLHKEIEYAAPTYLKGEYDLWVKAMNDSSLMLGLGVAGKVTLNGTGEFLEIISSSCYLTVAGETNKKYNLTQGVDVSTTEKLIGSCEVKNNFKTTITAQPLFETFWRTIYGKLVSSDTQGEIVLKTGEKKVVSYEIPTVKQPQAYDAVLSFRDSSGSVVSNSVRFHYVIQGISATIQNIRFDKDYYLKGQTADLMLSWSPSADSFDGSRLGTGSEVTAVTVEVGVKDSNGNTCASAFSKQVPVSEANSVLNIPITADCVNPSAELVIKDAQGNVLDKSTFNIETKSEVVKPVIPPAPAKIAGSYDTIIYVVIVLIILISAIFFLWKKKSSVVVPPMISFFFLVTASMFLFAGDANAHSFTVSGCGDGAGHCRTNYYTASISGTVFQPGQTVGAYLYGVATACSNGGSEIWAGAMGSWEGLSGFGHLLITQYGGSGGFSASGSRNFTAPTTPGSYYIRFCGNGGAYGCHDEPFTVVVPPPPCTSTPISTPVGSIFLTEAPENTTFQVKCDYGSTAIDSIDVVTNANNNVSGSDCTWAGTWDGTAAIFNCDADNIGTHDVSCVVNSNPSGANYCARPATVIDQIKVLDPEDCNPSCTSGRTCCRTTGQPGVCRVNCSSCTTDDSCGSSECCNKETSVCSTENSYCGALDFSLEASDISIYLTDNPVDHSGSTRVKATPGGGFARAIQLSSASILPTGSLTSGMITYDPDPLNSPRYTQGSTLTVNVPYNIIPSGTSKTYQLTIQGRAGTIENSKIIKVKIYGQSWAER